MEISTQNPPPPLRVHDLTVGFPHGAAVRHAVCDISFTLARGQGLAVVGESGCGKTTLARAILRLIPPPGRIVNGTIEFQGVNLIGLSPEAMRRVRGAGISLIFQEPGRALNPQMRVGDQIREALRVHTKVSSQEAERRVQEAMTRAAVPDPAYTARLYPHQLSGGLQQRIVLAMALVGRPSVLIADEPTTALDVTVQRQILDLLAQLQQELRLALLFITHDLTLIRSVAQQVLVMCDGRVVESGATEQILQNPRAPYTQELIAASPHL